MEKPSKSAGSLKQFINAAISDLEVTPDAGVSAFARGVFFVTFAVFALICFKGSSHLGRTKLTR